jgi:hypothetical protein
VEVTRAGEPATRRTCCSRAGAGQPLRDRGAALR